MQSDYRSIASHPRSGHEPPHAPVGAKGADADHWPLLTIPSAWLFVFVRFPIPILTPQKEEATSGRVTDTLNPWCCRLTRAEANFQQQRLAAVPAASLHIRAALLLRLNHRIEVTARVTRTWYSDSVSMAQSHSRIDLGTESSAVMPRPATLAVLRYVARWHVSKVLMTYDM